MDFQIRRDPCKDDVGFKENKLNSLQNLKIYNENTNDSSWSFKS